MSSCCLSGKVHEGKPVGQVERIGGIQAYVSEPESKSKAKSIIFIADSNDFLCPRLNPFVSLLMMYLPGQFSAGNSPMFASSPMTTLKLAFIPTSRTCTPVIRSLSPSSKTLNPLSKLAKTSRLSKKRRTPPLSQLLLVPGSSLIVKLYPNPSSTASSTLSA